MLGRHDEDVRWKRKKGEDFVISRGMKLMEMRMVKSKKVKDEEEDEEEKQEEVLVNGMMSKNEKKDKR